MKKTVFITGISKGIGFSLASIFLKNGCAVMGTSRSGSPIELSHPDLQIIKLDLADSQSFHHTQDLLKQKGVKIDILINNAAIGPDLGFELPTEESFRKTFDSNVTGTVFFTEAMIEHLAPKAKIINVSSKMGSIEVCTGTDSAAYRMSKTALNMYSKILTNRYANQHSIATIHPGWVRTTISNDNVHAPLSPEESAASIYKFIQTDFRSGIYWNAPEKTEIEW